MTKATSRPASRTAARRGTNLARIAGFNEAVLIDAIRRSDGGLSRVELTELTGLSAQTISNISRRMIEAGLVEEGEHIPSGVGKPRTLLSLAPHGQYAVGVHLDPLSMTYVLVDFTGRVIIDSQHPTPRTEPDEVLGLVTRAVADLITAAGIDRERIAGIGFASPGPIDTVAGVILDPPHLPGWRDVPLRDHLQQASGLDVLLDKDVIAAAVGERWTGATVGVANSVFLYLGTGIGAGLTVDDSVVRGFSGNAGDVGHLVVDPEGPLCSCGMHGCLGVVASPIALVRAAVAEGILPASHLAPERAADPTVVAEDFDRVAALADAGDTAALALVRRSAMHLAKAVSVLANIIDAEVVAFGGPTWSRLADQYLQVIPDLVRGSVVRGRLGELRVTGTALGVDVGAVGAACLVLERAFSPSATSFALQA